MCKFNPTKLIKLSEVVINSAHVVKIVRETPGKYGVYLNNHIMDGLMFAGSGSVDARQEVIIVCSTANSQDYRQITNWISHN